MPGQTRSRRQGGADRIRRMPGGETVLEGGLTAPLLSITSGEPVDPADPNTLAEYALLQLVRNNEVGGRSWCTPYSRHLPQLP